MKGVSFIISGLLLSTVFLYGGTPNQLSPDIQKKLNEAQKSEELIKQKPSPLEENEITPAPPTPHPETPSLEEEFAKEPSTPPATAPMGSDECAALPPSEQAFANSLSPSHKTTFCKKFSQDLRREAMNMVGKRDLHGVFISPKRAVEMIATENDIPIPYDETKALEEALNDTQESHP